MGKKANIKKKIVRWIKMTGTDNQSVEKLLNRYMLKAARIYSRLNKSTLS
jgi:hypothetical protein